MKEAIKLYFQYTPIWVYVYSIVNELVCKICVVYIAVIVPTVIAQYFTEQILFSGLLKVVGINISVVVVVIILKNFLGTLIISKYSIRLEKGIYTALFSKMNQLSLAYYDDNTFFEKYNLAIVNTKTAVMSIVNWLTNFFGLCVSVVTSTLIISLIDMKMLLIMFGCLFLGAVVEIMIAIIMIKLRKQSVRVQNVFDYISRVFYLKEYAIEMRTSNISRSIFSLFHKNLNEMNHIIKKISAIGLPCECIQVGISDVVMYFIFLGYACYSITVLKAFSVSELVALLMGALTLYQMLSQLINSFTQLFEDREKFKFYQEFMALGVPERSDGKKISSFRTSIGLLDVSFKYGDKKAISNLSLEIPAGSTLAIVGPNGSGKSTLLKIILQYYNIQSGKILLDGVNVSDYDVRSYRELFAFMNQTPAMFEMSIAENILLKKCETDKERTLVFEALEKVGLLEKVNSLKNNINCVIGKEFSDEGVIFSGGEIQKLAVARIIVSQRPIIILDEPSAHIDPLAEHNLYQLLKNTCIGKTIIFITHNIKNTVDADQIIWMENGGILESGKHSELMELGGKYCKSYNSLYNLLLED